MFQVKTDFDSEDRMLPTTIVWEDGIRYKTDRVKNIKPGFAAWPADKASRGEGRTYVQFV